MSLLSIRDTMMRGHFNLLERVFFDHYMTDNKLNWFFEAKMKHFFHSLFFFFFFGLVLNLPLICSGG